MLNKKEMLDIKDCITNVAKWDNDKREIVNNLLDKLDEEIELVNQLEKEDIGYILKHDYENPKETVYYIGNNDGVGIYDLKKRVAVIFDDKKNAEHIAQDYIIDGKPLDVEKVKIKRKIVEQIVSEIIE